MTRVLIDATNLKQGGAVQVAASFIDELRDICSIPTLLMKWPWLQTLQIEASPEVSANLTAAAGWARVIPAEKREWWNLSSYLVRHENELDVVFQVFGPVYGRKRARKRITGLADVTSFLPWPPGISAGTPAQQFRRALRGAVSRFIFARSDWVVSESASLLGAFVNQTGYDASRCSIVPNVLNSVFLELERTHHPLAVLAPHEERGELLVCYVARAYPHKNHEFLTRVHQILLARSSPVTFVVTLNEREWNGLSESFRAACINIGEVPVSHLPSLYARCRAAIFPSLMESYSVTPLEAMAGNGLLFASDRDFVRDVCGKGAIYFDPESPEDCADVLISTFAQREVVDQHRRLAREIVAAHSTARDRALSYIRIIDDVLTSSSAAGQMYEHGR